LLAADVVPILACFGGSGWIHDTLLAAEVSPTFALLRRQRLGFNDTLLAADVVPTFACFEAGLWIQRHLLAG